MNKDEIFSTQFTRVVLVDHRQNAPKYGIVFEKYNVIIDISIQDDGKTLKVFVTDQDKSKDKV